MSKHPPTCQTMHIKREEWGPLRPRVAVSAILPNLLGVEAQTSCKNRTMSLFERSGEKRTEERETPQVVLGVTPHTLGWAHGSFPHTILASTLVVSPSLVRATQTLQDSIWDTSSQIFSTNKPTNKPPFVHPLVFGWACEVGFGVRCDKPAPSLVQSLSHQDVLAQRLLHGTVYVVRELVGVTEPYWIESHWVSETPWV